LGLLWVLLVTPAGAQGTVVDQGQRDQPPAVPAVIIPPAVTDPDTPGPAMRGPGALQVAQRPPWTPPLPPRKPMPPADVAGRPPLVPPPPALKPQPSPAAPGPLAEQPPADTPAEAEVEAPPAPEQPDILVERPPEPQAPLPEPPPEPEGAAEGPGLAAVPASDQEFRLLFEDASATLSDEVRTRLGALSERMLADTSLRLQVRSYAGGTPETASQARRLSLNRALAVRAFLVDSGVRGTRIDVRALGNTAPDEPRDRVDVLLME
jgi:outer membrane protein OmpA-like peptidoglycan-associated protein